MFEFGNMMPLATNPRHDKENVRVCVQYVGEQ